MQSEKYWKYDINDGLRSVKIGIKNLINYLQSSKEGTIEKLSNISIQLIKDCIEEQLIAYKAYEAPTVIQIELIDLGILIDYSFNTDEVEFTKYNPELKINF